MRIQSAEYVRSAHVVEDFPRDGLAQVAFVGRSNVGKSSLLNRLLGRKALARVSSTPGRTRAINFFLVDSRYYFVDLPGFGYARASKDERRRWAELMDAYLNAPRPVGHRSRRYPLVVQIVDAKVGATDLDLQAHEYLTSLDVDILVAATKIDRVRRHQRPQALAAIVERLELPEGMTPLPVSARSGEGVPELWRAVAHRLEPTGRQARA